MRWCWLLLLAVCLADVCRGDGTYRLRGNLRDVSSHLMDYRLPHDVRPTGYTLTLVPHLEDGVFHGEVWVNITCNRRTATIILHAHEDLALSQASIYVNPLGSTVFPRKIGLRDTERDLQKQWLILLLSERLERDNSYRIHLSFNGSMDGEPKEGLSRYKFVDGSYNRTQWYADTNMRLDSARRIFPCFDEPEFKAAFEVKIATPSRQHVFTNMPLAQITDMVERPGWYWKHFIKSPPMATMSFGMFLFEFEHYSLSKGVLRVVGRTAKRADLEKALEHLENVYEYFLDYLDVDNPLAKLDLVVQPDQVRKVTSSGFGLITVTEQDANSLEAITFSTLGQWVGHLMSPQWWGEVDVSNGIVLHMGHTFLEKRNHLNVWDGYSTIYEYARLEPYKGIWSARDYGNSERAGWFLRMVEYMLTEDTFMTAFRRFLQLRQYETFSEHDLWTILTEHGWNEHNLPKNVLIEDMAKSWLTKDRLPVVTITRNYDRNTATIDQHMFLRKKFFRVEDKEQMLWYVPIMYLTPDNLNVSAIRPVAWMRNERNITIKDLPESHQFIIVNPAEIGMFLVNYDPTNWAMLADALQRRLLPTAVRAKLLHDALNLAYSGELNFNSAMNVTLFLSRETEYDVWKVMEIMLDHIGRFLDGTPAGEKFKRYFAHVATRAMEKIGDQRWSRGEEGNVYNLLRHSLRLASNRKPTQRQKTLFEAWARGYNDTSPRTVEAMCLTFKHGTMEEFEQGWHRTMEVLRMRQDSSPHGLLRLIVNCARQPEKIERILSVMLLGQNTVFKDTDRSLVTTQLTGFYNGYSTMFSFLQQNWDALRQALADKPDIWVDFVVDSMTLFKTEAGLKQAAHWFADRREEFGNAAPAVQAGIEEMTANVQWSRENVPVLEHWLDQHLPAEEARPVDS